MCNCGDRGWLPAVDQAGLEAVALLEGWTVKVWPDETREGRVIRCDIDFSTAREARLAWDSCPLPDLSALTEEEKMAAMKAAVFEATVRAFAAAHGIEVT